MQKKILIIEDEPDLVGALSEAIANRGYDVRTAATGEDGLKQIEEEKPDLLLLDSLLPGLSGLEVLQRLQPLRESEGLPIIMLSNVDNPEDLKEARNYNISDYLVKTDWRMDDIVSKIEKII